MSVKRFAWWLILVSSFLGCGEDPVAPPETGNGGPIDSGPLEVFEVFLRPYVIYRGSSLAGTLPNPQEPLYALTAFYRGGQPGPQFTWQFDPVLGDLQPKTIELTSTSATVALLNSGQTPLGFYDITAQGQSAGETSSASGRVAVVELNWMKHQRPTITNISDPPVDLSLNPTFVPDAGGDLIYFIGSPSKQAVNIWSIRANATLSQPPQPPLTPVFRAPHPSAGPADTVCVAPVSPPQIILAEEREPDFSPVGNGRDEILFSSQMDGQFFERLQARNNEAFPFNLWVVKKRGVTEFCAKQLTFDASFDSLGGTYFRVWRHRQPRWDPSAAAGARDVRVAFLSNRGVDGDATVAYGTNIWMGDLRDDNLDDTSDELLNLRRVTDVGGLISFDWTPDGQSIYFLRAGKALIYRLDVNSQAIEEISLASIDPELEDFRFLSVFRGDPNLLTFQASSEGRAFIYVYDVAAGILTRVTPYEFTPGKNLFPRWHPTRREIVFVCDYTVARWLPSGDTSPITGAVVGGMRRTLYPSVWTIRLQEP